MNTVITVLQFILKLFTTIADLIMKIPQPLFWAIKLIPGVNKIWAALEGSRTILINTLAVIITFMEAKDWTGISQWVCEVLTFVFQLFNKAWVCDSTWIPTIAGLLLAIINVVLRTITKGESSVKPLTAKK